MKKNITDEARKRISQGAINSNRSRAERVRREYETNPTKCQYCDILLPFEKRGHKFCNRSCAASFNNSKHIKRPREIELRKCLYCNKESYNPKYCSVECHNNFNKNKKLKVKRLVIRKKSWTWIYKELSFTRTRT